MSGDVSDLELVRLEIPNLEAEGYQVIVQPTGTFLPPFLKGITPDAIAVRGNEKLVIEVVRRTAQKAEKIKAISERVKQEPGWTLRLIGTNTRIDEPAVQSRDVILERVREARKLARSGHADAALLMAWATMEATARMRTPEQYRRPQTPGRIIETLTEAGELKQAEAAFARALIEKRNKLIHGQLGVDASKAEVERFLDIVTTLLNQPEKAA